MQIRYAQLSVIPEFLALGQQMTDESRFRVYGMNHDITRKMLEHMLSQQPDKACILLAQRKEGGLVGMLAGYVTEFFFCDHTLVQDRFYYVSQEFRGSPAAFKLMIAFRRWAESKRADELSINMSVDIDAERFNKFMGPLGFNCCGSNFAMRLSYQNATAKQPAVA
jgi:hypothetical protein